MAKEDDQLSLFEPARREEFPSKDESEVEFLRRFIDSKEADYLLASLSESNEWSQDFIRIFGKAQPLPRLHRWFADAEQPYRWSGIEMNPEPFPDYLREILARLWDRTGIQFNTALGNLYRDGKDSVAWHSDDEPDLGPNPIIASLSLGATRRFLLRRKDNHKEIKAYELSHGSLLLMSGSTQAHWEHTIPKTRQRVEPRINLTFRSIYSRPLTGQLS